MGERDLLERGDILHQSLPPTATHQLQGFFKALKMIPFDTFKSVSYPMGLW